LRIISVIQGAFANLGSAWIRRGIFFLKTGIPNICKIKHNYRSLFNLTLKMETVKLVLLR